jgi:hypothetical protein
MCLLQKKEVRACTLTNTQLTKKLTDLVIELSGTSGRAWKISSPPDYNNDPDLLFLELISRFNSEINKFHPVYKGKGISIIKNPGVQDEELNDLENFFLEICQLPSASLITDISLTLKKGKYELQEKRYKKIS